MNDHIKFYPVILSGGSGTRLWPVSRSSYPKQFLKFHAKYTYFQQTCIRGTGIQMSQAPIIVANEEHQFIIAEQLKSINCSAQVVLEPSARSTAPAVAVAAMHAIQCMPDAILIVMPSDHVIEDPQAFYRVIDLAMPNADKGELVTFGVVPSCPESGYGYIQYADNCCRNERCYRIERFIEKPGQEKAQQLLNAGRCYWNSGIFMFKASAYLNELNRFCPDIFVACQMALEKAEKIGDYLRLPEDYGLCRPESIDYGVMEKTQTAVVIPTQMGWRDIGCWDALWDISPKSPEGNVFHGDTYTSQVTNSMIHAESRMVVALGIQDQIIVETPDVVMVANKNSAEEVKKTVAVLKAAKRKEQAVHLRVIRPWGYFESIDQGDRFQVKHLYVNPGAKLSLQMHHHRAEHWIVVSGTAKVTCGDNISLLGENESTYISMGTRHRLENPGKIPLHVIEVQSGSYFDEDDIVRFDDVYQRC